MKLFKLKLRKIKPCVYEVWSVDRYGFFGRPLGVVGKFSALCKDNGIYADLPEFRNVADCQWVFYSLYYESRVFDDYISAFRYARVPGSGA